MVSRFEFSTQSQRKISDTNMKANKKETDPWAWAKAWTSKTQKKKEAAGKNLKRSEILLKSIKLCSLSSDFK